MCLLLAPPAEGTGGSRLIDTTTEGLRRRVSERKRARERDREYQKRERERRKEVWREKARQMVFTALFLRLDLYHEPGPPPPLLLSYTCSLVLSKAFLFLNEPLTASTRGLSPSLFTSPPSLFAPSPLNYTTLTHSEPQSAALSNSRTPPSPKDLFQRAVCPSFVL